MKVSEVPQDLKYLKGHIVRDQDYAVDNDGKYQMVMSDGWEAKNDALELALEEDKDKEERSRMEVKKPVDFQGFELDISHQAAAHCENGSISSLLRYEGIDLSEPMIFGLASGLYFAHLPFVKLGGYPVTAFRTFPGVLFKRITKQLNIKTETRRFLNKEHAMQELDKVLMEEKRPMLYTLMLAYALSRREYVLRKFITTVMVLTMYVNAGLIPNYLLISRTLSLSKSYWVYIIPTMFSCFNMIVIRTYIGGLPDALVESARIDGAGDIRVFWQIIFPLCMPVLATVALFVAVGSWNSWFDTHLYNAGKKNLHSLQYLLKMKLATTQASANAAKSSAEALASTTQTTPVTIRCAITVISTVPILIVYPFLQKYFVTGMALGSVKG